MLPKFRCSDPQSMTSYCKSVLSEGRCTFTCPYVDAFGRPSCNQRWEFFLVSHVACLSADERKDFEKKIIENYEKKAAGIQKCPGCVNYCQRKDRNNRRVFCAICTHTKKRNFEFCWNCLGEWTVHGTDWCGNQNCDGLDERIRILSKCKTKLMTYCNQECPMIRGCPKCGMLIEHMEACKHMDCPSCKHSFCFVCLMGKKSDGTWECGSYQRICNLAPRQPVLPGSE